MDGSADDYEELGALPEEGAASMSTSDGLTAAGKRDRAKIIKRYHFNYETETFDDSHSYLKEQIVQYGGYVSSSEMTGTELHTLSLTARYRPKPVMNLQAGWELLEL